MPPPEMKTHILCVLRRAPQPPELNEAEEDDLQARHLAYQGELRSRGKTNAAGPFRNQPDETWRGLTVYTTTLEEARALAVQDPAVREGHLVVDVFTWLTPVE